MASRTRRFIFGFLAGLILLCLVGGILANGVVRRSFPQVDGQVHLTGLQNPVEIYRDSFGIPQIYAANTHDLFFAEGYVHAQERFWQMDFWRHIGSGRLSEMFGKSSLPQDRFLRTMGWARVAQQELEHMDADTLTIMQAYSEGVNAYLADHQGSALSLEYVILGALNSSYRPEPWTPLHSITWAKVMAWDLRGNMDEEIERSILLKTLSAQQVDELFPPFPSDHPVIVPTPNTSSASLPATLSNPQLAVELAAQISSLNRRVAALDQLVGSAGDGIGSNNWVISGKRTTSGKPLLANDPHLSAQMPSIWFEVGLHCINQNAACPFEVTGFSFAGDPGVIIGHNARIAWGDTNTGPDVMDLYIEKINPQNPDQYEVNGKWVDMQKVQETIQTGGGQTEAITIRYTRHGPVLSDTYGDLKDFNQTSGIQLPANYALSLRWTALEPSFLFRSILRLDQAQSWQDFRTAAQDFVVPAQNLIYADVDGNIGYQMPGNIPMRASGNGRLPVPGWTDEYEWTGYIPFDQHPFAYNPPQGFIATANNAVVGPDYPHPITTDWDYGFRAARIVEMINAAPGPIDIAYLQKIQGDDKDLNAATLVPLLMQISLNDAHLASVRSILAKWDFQDSMDSAPAALFAAFWKHLLADTFQDKLPQDYWPGGGDRWFEVVRNLIKQPTSAWWDRKSTPAVETRDDIFRQAFTEAVAELEGKQGKEPSRWTWGDLHTLTFQNQSLGESGIAPIEALFNRGPFRTAGGSSIVNATGWDATTNQYTVTALPSMRMIVDLGDLSNSLTVHTTGESGHAFDPHYIDMADLWRNIQYHPMLWEASQIQPAAKSHQTLVP